MKYKHFGAALAAVFAASMIVAPAAADTTQNKRSGAGILPAIAGPIGVAAAVGSTATTISWTTIATKTWTFPWQHIHIHKFVPIPNPTLPNSWAVQGLHATGQHLHNLGNPNYFGQTLNISNPLPLTNGRTGEHAVSAKYKEYHNRAGKSRSQQGKMVVGCVMGSALGAITAAVRKASAMGNPPRLRSQAEHEAIVKSGVEKRFELTSDEASMATAFCGLGSLLLRWQQAAAPVAVRAKF
jgi:hypothetical protein